MRAYDHITGNRDHSRFATVRSEEVSNDIENVVSVQIRQDVLDPEGRFWDMGEW